MNKELIMASLKTTYEKLEALGYNVFVVVLQGSQNYNLDLYSEEYTSDVDCKAFVLPSFHDVYAGNMVSKVLETEDGQVEVKDIRLLNELLAKANPSYLELLASDYFITSDAEAWNQIRDLLPSLVVERKALLIKCIYGMAKEKEKALCHPYPSIVGKIEHFGYDPKQAHHIERLSLMLDALVGGNHDLKTMLVHADGSSTKRHLTVVKLGVYSLEEIKAMVDVTINHMKEVKDSVESAYPISGQCLYTLGDIIEGVVKSFLKNQLTNS